MADNRIKAAFLATMDNDGNVKTFMMSNPIVTQEFAQGIRTFQVTALDENTIVGGSENYTSKSTETAEATEPEDDTFDSNGMHYCDKDGCLLDGLSKHQVDTVIDLTQDYGTDAVSVAFDFLHTCLAVGSYPEVNPCSCDDDTHVSLAFKLGRGDFTTSYLPDNLEDIVTDFMSLRDHIGPELVDKTLKPLI